ncbi:MAG: Pycsar system effector family protein [Bacteroidota bacterium]
MNLINQAAQFVSQLFEEELAPVFVYHNFNHTKAVVEAVEKIAKQEQISDEDTEKLLLAAWFHDTGYVKCCDNHEAVSGTIATAFLKERDYSEEAISEVVALIDTTRFNDVPKTTIEKIMRDADYSHLAKTDYFATSELLREELHLTLKKEFTDLEWAKENLQFLTQHHQFYSDYAIQHWQPQKEKNIQKILTQITKSEATMNEDPVKTKKKKDKEDKPERSIDTMFKITLTNHIRLSEIADSKANILLSVNAIIISIALSTIVPKLDNPANTHLIMPTFIMVIFSVVSIIFAILSTKPKVTSGKFTRQDIEDKKVNLLFFGNFFKMPYEEYQWAVNELLKDREYLYNSMTKDLYYLGLVLERKYRLLRITYNVFMIGIIVSVIAFVVAFRSTSV